MYQLGRCVKAIIYSCYSHALLIINYYVTIIMAIFMSSSVV